MTRGKKTCKILKEIRQQIADKNDIEYVTSECHFQGECKGTCPKCEAEVKYLEDELRKRKQFGKAVSIAGISLGIAGSFAACNTPQQPNMSISEWEIANIDTIPPPPFLGGVKAEFGFDFEIEDEHIVADTVKKNFDDEDVFLSAEKMPEYLGGDKALRNFLQENLIYPKEAEEKGIEGRVIVSFVIEKDGSVTNFTIYKGVDSALDEEAIRVLKLMPKWKAGELKGKTVRVKYILPVSFKLNNDK